MRLHKSNAELDIMRQVNVISGGAHQRAMQQTKAGKFEYQIEAELLHEFATNGARTRLMARLWLAAITPIFYITLTMMTC